MGGEAAEKERYLSRMEVEGVEGWMGGGSEGERTRDNSYECIIIISRNYIHCTSKRTVT